jgi:hypothetical protein
MVGIAGGMGKILLSDGLTILVFQHYPHPYPPGLSLGQGLGDARQGQFLYRHRNGRLGRINSIDDHLLQVVTVASNLAVGIGINRRLIMVEINLKVGILG